MPEIVYEIFTQKWLERANREEKKDAIDMGDKFISLWIAFNGWMRGKYGENVTDRNLLNLVKNCEEMEEEYKDLMEKDDLFISNIEKLKQYEILNMRYPEDESRNKKYEETYESLIDVFYQVRCNLFHGRKNPKDQRVNPVI